MALGGGTFVTQNKVLPGAYINFVSKSNGVNIFGTRGVGAIAKASDWGDSSVRVITKEDFQKNSLGIFGYDYSSDELAFARDFFKHSITLLYYPLLSVGSTKASNAYATAKYAGKRGNDIRIVIAKNVDDDTKFEVSTYIDTVIIDEQLVTSADELTDNDFVVFKKDAVLAVTAGTALTGGETVSSTNADIQNFLNKIESYSFDAITTCGNADDLLVEWTKRIRDSVGKKFQAVVCNYSKPDYEGIVNVYGDNWINVLPWVCGALAGCQVNESLTNTVYDGEGISQADAIEYATELTQRQLEENIGKGYFVFHRVDDDVRVLDDINSLTTFTETKGKVFCSNQTVRVCDQIANDIAAMFNNYYLGKVPNDDAGRDVFRGEIIKHHNNLVSLRAITDFEDTDVTVEQGDDKGSVVVTDAIIPVNAMNKLYMTVYVE